MSEQASPASSTAGTAAPAPDAAGAAPTGQAPPAQQPPAGEAKTPATAELERRLAAVIKGERTVEARAKEVATGVQTKYSALDELLAKDQVPAEEIVRVAKGIFGKHWRNDLLVAMGVDFAPKELTPETIEEQISSRLKAEFDERERQANAKVDEVKRTQDAAAEQEEMAALDAYLSASAQFLVDNAAEFHLCDKLGVDAVRYQQVTNELMEKEPNKVPDPRAVYAVLEAEHLAKLKATRYGPKDPELETTGDPGKDFFLGLTKDPAQTEAARPVLPPIRPNAAPTPVAYASGDDEARAFLDRMAQEDRDLAARGVRR